MVILQACAFAAPAPGNFIPALAGLETVMRTKGFTTIYAFPESARQQEWCKDIQNRAKVYFLPETHARILPETYRDFIKIYQENDVRIIHSHFELYDIPVTLTAPKQAKIFWHLHDALKENYEAASLSRRILTIIQYGLVGRKAKLLSASEFHASFAIKLGFPKENIEYIPNGINLSRIHVKVPMLSKTPVQLLLFGWEVYRKGVDLIVAAIKKTSDNLRIKIVGQDDCETYIRQVGTPSCIVYSRPVKDVNELYQESSVFLHISRAEGLSYALLEAVYAGLPVICSDIPENQFARAFRNITWVRSGDVFDLANALQMSNKIAASVRTEDIQYNRALIDAQYSLESWIQRITLHYLT